MASAAYNPAIFYFRLQFANNDLDLDNAFQEVAGLPVESGVEEVREGEQNLHKHRLVAVPKQTNVVMKRGFVGSTSALATWCNAMLSGDFSRPLVPHNLLITLCNSNDQPLASWSLLDAWPVKWSMSDFKSQEKALAIETLEFAFSACQRV